MRGKVTVYRHYAKNTRDHPRLCGEKRRKLRIIFIRIGSPPPMRGKGTAMPPDCGSTRITPAYAGKSAEIFRRFDGSKDHPRLCGEKTGSRSRTGILSGSPPPMRGKGIQCRIWNVPVRITPAYAGKSYRCPFCQRHSRDHPRLCGEKPLFGIVVFTPLGSPPPMRGKVWFCVRNAPAAGITPAYAGKRQKPNKAWL